MGGTIMITGATAGIGLAAGAPLCRDGLDRCSPPAAAASGSMRWRRSSATGFARSTLDMRDIAAVEAAARATAGAVDLLLNNAGLASPLAPLQDAEWDPLETVIDDQHHRPRRAHPGAAAGRSSRSAARSSI